MTDSVSGAPSFELADLKQIGFGANVVGRVSDDDTFVITTPGTNASLVDLADQDVTTFTTDGGGTGGSLRVTMGSAGEVTKVVMIGGTGYDATDIVTITVVEGDAMDTDCVLTIQTEEFTVVRGVWNARAVVAVSDHPADDGDGNERAYFVQDSLNNVWRLGRAKQGGQTGNKSGPQIVIPE